jgi:regulatory protein
VERSDDHLATVSYLFGAPAPAPSDDPVVDEEQARGAAGGALNAVEVPSEHEQSGREPGESRLAPVRTAFRDPGSGWYLDPDEVEADGDGADADGQSAPARERDSVPTQPPAGAVAAARAFLSTVEKTAAAPSERTGVRFVEENEEFESESDSGRSKPPPVRQASLNALARKGMSSAEMTSLLEAREVDPDEVVAEVARLEEVGLLDDRVLAEHLVRTLQDRKGLGRSAINAELRRRKVDQAAIDEVLETVDVDEELQRCLEVATKRASQLRSYDRATAERRLSAFLMRRGYAGSVISAAVAQALGPVGPRFR